MEKKLISLFVSQALVVLASLFASGLLAHVYFKESVISVMNGGLSRSLVAFAAGKRKQQHELNWCEEFGKLGLPGEDLTLVVSMDEKIICDTSSIKAQSKEELLASFGGNPAFKASMSLFYLLLFTRIFDYRLVLGLFVIFVTACFSMFLISRKFLTERK